ncbi:MAG: hypothetical protein ACFFCZ_14965 [Promethearchaeota archaeon]
MLSKLSPIGYFFVFCGIIWIVFVILNPQELVKTVSNGVAAFALGVLSAGFGMLTLARISQGFISAVIVFKQISPEILVISPQLVLAKKEPVYLLSRGIGIFVLLFKSLQTSTYGKMHLPLWYGLRNHERIDRVGLVRLGGTYSIPLNGRGYGTGEAIGYFVRSRRLSYRTTRYNPDTLLKIITRIQETDTDSFHQI